MIKATILKVKPNHVSAKLTGFDNPDHWLEGGVHLFTGRTKPLNVEVGQVYEAVYESGSNFGLWFLGECIND